MRIEQFTVKAQEAIQAGQALARRAGNPQFEPEHLALALLTQEQGVVPAIVQRIGTEPQLLRDRLEEALAKLPKVSGGEGHPLAAPSQSL